MDEFKDFNVILLSYKIGLFDIKEAVETLRWQKYQVERSGENFSVVWEKEGVRHEDILSSNQLVELGKEVFDDAIIY